MVAGTQDPVLALREFAVALDTYLRSNRETAMTVVKDAFEGAIGLAESRSVALGVQRFA